MPALVCAFQTYKRSIANPTTRHGLEKYYKICISLNFVINHCILQMYNLDGSDTQVIFGSNACEFSLILLCNSSNYTNIE